QGAEAVAGDVADLDGEGFDAAVDCTGAPAAIEAAVDALGRGGRLLVFGVAPERARVSLSPFRIYHDEITVVGSMAVLHSFGAALDLVARGVVEADALVTDTMPLTEWPDALARVRAGTGLKIHIDPGREFPDALPGAVGGE
ncbi:zinc-binding dehydrogenase, partial [Saccharomonospora iraqiensis]|uniref:zinc-binding dehydrogenase n=1 Tax=Saccharomonospora iraqiensis TaxID=52698 RepID=UPI00022E0E9B